MKALSLLAAAWLATATLAAQADVVVNVPGGPGGAGTRQPVSYPVPVGTVLEFDNPVLLTLDAGDYRLSPVVAGGVAGALFSGWNFEAPQPGSWGNHVVLGAALPDGRWSVLLDANGLIEPSCRNHFCAWDTEAQAVTAWLATPPFALHLASATTVGIVAADYFLPDNLGGVSLVISSVPEPGTGALLAAGGLLLGGWLWRGRARAHPVGRPHPGRCAAAGWPVSWAGPAA